MKSRHTLAYGLGILSLGFAVAASFAHGGATGIVGERMNGMMMLQEQVRRLNPMFNGGETLQPDVISMAAKMIADHAGLPMLDLFPENSIEGPSEAKPEIWQRWELFESQALRLEHLGRELGATIVQARAEPVLQVVEQPVPASEPLSEWESMDAAVLLGLVSRAESGLEQSTDDEAEPETSNAPQLRAPAVVFAEIVSTCSSCHTQFRE